STDVVAAAATPIRVGGQLAGALSFSQVDHSREWTADDVRLIEAVAQELRVAITAAEAFERQRAAVVELERVNRAKSDFLPLVGEMNGDRDKLTQVMANLLSNAVKYSPNGGEIVVSTRAEGGAAHVVVRDHGMGIPKASLEAIFERYGRVESLATRHIQGTGL